jgi:hypothetical protein
MKPARPLPTPQPQPVTEADWARLHHALAVAVAEANGWRLPPAARAAQQRPAGAGE